MWFIYALLSGLCATGVAVIAKWANTHHDMYIVTTIRAFFMVFTIFVITVALRKNVLFTLNNITSRDLLILVITGIIGGCGWLFYFIALEYGDASYVVAIDKLSIVFVLILSYYVLGESITILNIVGGLLMIFGAWLIVSY